MIVVIGENQLGHLVGHRCQQGITFLGRQPTRCNFSNQQNLDVDFMIRCVDPGGVVNEVRVDAAALFGVFDAAELGQAQVPALGNTLSAYLTTVDP